MSCILAEETQHTAAYTWIEDVIRPHNDHLETTSLLNGVHNEKQIAYALHEIGRADLIGSSNMFPSIP